MTAVEATKPTPLVPLEGLSREDWLDVRRQGIGGSDAPAIVGLDRFRSAYVTYLDKLGELPEADETEAMHWGNRLEQAVADEFADRSGFLVTTPESLFRHPEHSWMLANPDRIVVDADGQVVGGLEVKTSRLDEDWADSPPARVVVQCQHYMEVMGWSQMWVAVLLHGRSYAHWPIPRDDVLIAMLVDEEARFWQRVEERDPPPVDGHPSTSRALDSLYARSGADTSMELDDAAAELVHQLGLAKRMQSDAAADVAAITNQLKLMLGETEVGLIGGEPVVSWKSAKPKDRKHNCPDCAHAPEGPPWRPFVLRGANV